MGWWTESTEGAELLIGDEPVDAASAVIDEIATAYIEDVKRRPTPDELARTLELALLSRVDSLLDGCEEKQLQSVKIKLRKRSKTQIMAAGDYFAVPLPSGGYGFGRIRRRFLRTVVLGDFLAIRSDKKLSAVELARAPVLFEALFGYARLAGWQWQILGNLPISEPESPLPERLELEEHARRLRVSYGPLGIEARLDDELGKRAGDDGS